ncbi:MAG: TrkH family potassium uptake protein [Acidimicrobiales bacterium]
MTDNDRVQRPGALVVGAFAGLIAVGTALLSLNISHRPPMPVDVSVSDAFFTASSAVTVTGLVVVDTQTVWSPFGEAVILVLMQVGGLGIMTLAGFMGIALNRRLGLRTGLLASAELGLTEVGVLRHLIRDIVRFVAASEVAIAALLTFRFLLDEENGFWRSVHLGVFHAVSAFNNAGFSILDGGLERYVSDWYMNIVVAGSFILGGIGFPVVFELRRRWREPQRWSLHTKVTLAMSAGLLTLGTVLIAMVEWSNEATMGPLGSGDKFLASFFQSATARTAGFNTVSIGSLKPATWMVLILLMVVGGGSASTAGGIKVSTFAAVVRSTLSELRRDQVTTMFSRQIPGPVQRQSLALVVAALGTVGTSTFLLLAMEPAIPLGELLLEAASAFGTVGLSTGVTGQLSTLGRLLIIALMFVGRVGPITFGTAVLLRPERRQYEYAEEALIVG